MEEIKNNELDKVLQETWLRFGYFINDTKVYSNVETDEVIISAKFITDVSEDMLDVIKRSINKYHNILMDKKRRYDKVLFPTNIEMLSITGFTGNSFDLVISNIEVINIESEVVLEVIKTLNCLIPTGNIDASFVIPTGGIYNLVIPIKEQLDMFNKAIGSIDNIIYDSMETFRSDIFAGNIVNIVGIEKLLRKTVVIYINRDTVIGITTKELLNMVKFYGIRIYLVSETMTSIRVLSYSQCVIEFKPHDKDTIINVYNLHTGKIVSNVYVKCACGYNTNY